MGHTGRAAPRVLLSSGHGVALAPDRSIARSDDLGHGVGSLRWGRFDAERWRRGWQELFDTHTLAHNRRAVRKIVVSAEGDGAFAVVDIDTLWRHKQTGAEQQWKGRTCKIYTQVGTQWKMIAQTGVLEY